MGPWRVSQKKQSFSCDWTHLELTDTGRPRGSESKKHFRPDSGVKEYKRVPGWEWAGLGLKGFRNSWEQGLSKFAF